MLESKTGCKISIRGKGASKTKRVELDSDDKLHVLIQAETDENLEKGINMVEKILRGEDEDELKRNQRL
jgi:splicing factor 1